MDITTKTTDQLQDELRFFNWDAQECQRRLDLGDTHIIHPTTGEPVSIKDRRDRALKIIVAIHEEMERRVQTN